VAELCDLNMSNVGAVRHFGFDQTVHNSEASVDPRFTRVSNFNTVGQCNVRWVVDDL